MRKLITIYCILLTAILASCDVRSEIAKKNMEKYVATPTPTPSITPAPTEEPMDPADVMQVDVNMQGETMSIEAYDESKTSACTKFNRVMLNGDRNKITIKGACRQIMINGDGNEVIAEAAMEVVFNGSKNTVKYARFPNGKRPAMIENRTGNTMEKIPAMAIGRAPGKIAK